ncbi:MAG: hypothetical protein ABIH03_02600 [Pseudomonadota bacterium]
MRILRSDHDLDGTATHTLTAAAEAVLQKAAVIYRAISNLTGHPASAPATAAGNRQAEMISALKPVSAQQAAVDAVVAATKARKQ